MRMKNDTIIQDLIELKVNLQKRVNAIDVVINILKEEGLPEEGAVKSLPVIGEAVKEVVIAKEVAHIPADPSSSRSSVTPSADAKQKVRVPQDHYPIEWEITLKDKDVVKLYKVVSTVNSNCIKVFQQGLEKQVIPLGMRENAYSKIKQMTYNQAYAGHTVNILRTAHKNSLYGG